MCRLWRVRLSCVSRLRRGLSENSENGTLDPPTIWRLLRLRGYLQFDDLRYLWGDVIHTSPANLRSSLLLASLRHRGKVDGFVQVNSAAVVELLPVPDGGRLGLCRAQDVDRRWEQQRRGLRWGSVARSGAATWTKLCGTFEAGDGYYHASRGKHTRRHTHAGAQHPPQGFSVCWVSLLLLDESKLQIMRI